ncbi:PAS domain S-box-containing protein [Nonomuraea solani]|uniref:PAS domain S-box-containing protein n=1 Tax=Nonomuraea solani TaxID=1144553 RepID=A0A1H6EH68_9ACTN|nr:PAS domain S-box protein [Nonomuraea solani]SEG97188.1 PAS domain S-box-containing protein [Nonomuraea solani]
MPARDQSQEDMRLLVQSIRDYAIFMLDPGGVIVSWNIGAQRIKGYLAEEIIGTHFSAFYPPDDVASGKPAMGLRAAATEGRWEEEGWRVRKDGTRFWASVVITPLYDESGGLRGFGKVTRDLTERRSMARAFDERGMLLARLVQAQERERRRIASDVHDDTIQFMVAVGMRLRLLGENLPESYASAVHGLDDAVDDAVQRLRDLTFGLRPPADGLVESLAGYLEQTMTGVAFELVHDLDDEPPAETVVTVYRICQESLTNVRKHAMAGRVVVELASVQRGVHVRVRDDGVGLVSADKAAGHFGLVEMRERAEAAGGWWNIRGEAGTGTTVEFWVPAVPRVPSDL